MSVTRYRLLDLEIDLDGQRVTRDGVALDVQGLTFQLLAYLLHHGVAVVSFDQLIADVWAPAIVGEETVTQRVKLLRQALGDDGRAPRYIRSVRGRGYQLCASPTSVGDAAIVASRRPLSKRLIWVLLPLVLMVAGGVWWRHSHAPATRLSATQELVQRAAYYAGIGQRDNNERAVTLYQQVLATTPDNNDARIGLSRAYSARVCLYNFPYEWAHSARQLADTAVTVEPQRASGWSALAYARDCLGDMDGAITAYRQAYKLDPTDDASRASAAYLDQEQGRLDEALRANLNMRGDPSRVRFRDVQIARELELLGFVDAADRRFERSFQLYPDNVFSNVAWPRHLFLQGRQVEAQAALDQAIARNTPHVELYVLAGELALLRNDRQAAQSAFKQAATLRPQMSWPATLTGLYGSSAPTPDWLDERISALRAQISQHTMYPADLLELAMLLEAHGQREAALDAIGTAVANGYSDSAYLQTSPLLKPLAGEPAYAAAIASINRRITAQRQRVLAADWCPPELRGATH
ncbi:winged helix-turn-helix domain-containing protein [Dyella sp. 20L07]|uniref:winged helix-turn-helix domain-containing protein n=1 Tax=Dyella sp. 20L07 TaxID=3384240 RepID=UPI003D2C5085